MVANDAQMQTYADQRIRVRAEQARALVAALRDDKSSIDDVYARTDGPPHLLQAGNSANPDDVLNYNAFASALLDLLDGAGTDATNAATLRGAWAVFQRACVRPVGQ